MTANVTLGSPRVSEGKPFVANGLPHNSTILSSANRLTLDEQR